jgi:hypothetical protein
VITLIPSPKRGKERKENKLCKKSEEAPGTFFVRVADTV